MKGSQGENYPIHKTLTESQIPPIIDDINNDGTVIYKGYADLGIRQDEAAWKISKTTKSGTVTITEFAEGSTEYQFAWSLRTTYNYSR